MATTSTTTTTTEAITVQPQQQTPPRLAMSALLPSVLMDYFTCSDSPALQQDTEQNQNKKDSTESHKDKGPGSAKQTAAGADNTPRNSRNNPNRNSLPLMRGDTDDGFSNSHSREGSLMSANDKAKRRSARPKTCFTINHAPPKASARHKIHVRARPLLQLHQICAASRPMPAFELLPSAIFSPSLSRAINKAFRTRHGLCPADLAIVKAEKYHQHEQSPKEEDESRDVLALICKGRKGDGNAASKAKIFLEDGSEWEAYALPNGGYEFFSTDEHGLGMTARWVLRRPRARRSQSASDMSATLSDQSTKKFTFSTISPSSRRHPVIASLSSTSLDINDSYTAPSALPSSPEFTPPPSEHEHGAEDAGPESPVDSAEPIETTSSLRALVTATAIWVTLREGWCPGYRYDDLMLRSPSLKLNHSPTKSFIDAPMSPSLKDDLPTRSGSIARIFRSAGALKRRSTSSTPIDGTTEEASLSRNSSTRATARRPRAESTSTVIIHSKRPRRRRADTSSTATSIPNHADMTEEEDSIEREAALLANSSKRSSAPTPLIPSVEPTDSGIDDGHTKRESSTTSSKSTLDPRKQDSDVPEKQRKSRRFRSIFCGM